MLDDSELLRRYAEDRAEAAFAELVQRHVGLVYHAALRQLGDDPAAAHDVTQAVFVDLARKARYLSRREVLASWLHASTRYAAANTRRARARRLKHETEAALMYTQEQASAPEADWQKLRPLIDEVVHELNAADRAAVLLRFFEQRPFAEIGAALRVSEDAARMRVDRALEKLRGRLARRGVVSTGAALGLLLGSEAAGAMPVGLASGITSSALSVAVVTVAPAATWLSLMSTTKFTAGAAVLTLAAVVGTIGYDLHANRAAEAKLAQARNENTTTLAALREVQQRTAMVRAALAANEEKVRAQEAEHARAAATAEEARRAALAKGDAFMARHPEVKRLYQQDRDARRAAIYEPLFRALDFPPARAERLRVLLGQTEKEGSLTAGDLGRLQFTSDLYSPTASDEMTALLGEEGELEFHLATLHGGNAVESAAEIAGELFETAAPLTPAQAQGLLRILIEGRAEWRAPEGGRQLTYDWEAILPRARDLLSAEQMKVLLGHRASDEVRQAQRRRPGTVRVTSAKEE